MNYTRYLMSASAVTLGLLGLCCLFAPVVMLGQFKVTGSGPAAVIVQVTGALYLGFAALNWIGRGQLIGGIYGRPVTIGNLYHYLAASLIMIKVLWQGTELPILWPLTVLYVIFAVSFAMVLFRHPPHPAVGASAKP